MRVDHHYSQCERRAHKACWEGSRLIAGTVKKEVEAYRKAPCVILIESDKLASLLQYVQVKQTEKPYVIVVSVFQHLS